MLIAFKCRYCRQPHSVDVSRAGRPFVCPLCDGEVLVPSASDPFTVAEAVPAREPSPFIAPPSDFPTDAPPPATPDLRRVAMGAALAAAAALVLIGGYLTSKERALERQQDEERALAEIEALQNPPADGPAPPLPPARQPGPIVPGPKVRPELPISPTLGDFTQPRPEKAAEARPVGKDKPEAAPQPPARAAAEPKPALKRRQPLSEEELRQQLARVPEVGLAITQVPGLLQAYQASARVSGGTNVEPTVLLRLRPDLRGFPVRQGSACRLDLPSAVTLQTLSQKLRVYLRAAVPRDREGNRPDPTLLRDLMRLETRGPRPEWLRAEAIPTMQQLLMHEDPPLRRMLVDLLAEVAGPAATAALAQRAVFDLSPEVREAAVASLANRPLDDARPWLLYGLRYPWAPAADHAAEALVALADREAVPQLVSLLKQPDPCAPTTAGGGQFVREVVRANHLNNCLLCHPPGLTGSEPVLGLDPVVRIPSVTTNRSTSTRPTTQVSAVQRLQSTPGAHGYGGGGGQGGGGTVLTARTGTRRTSTTTIQVNAIPLLIRGDVTYLRQDFSVQLPVPVPALPPGAPVPPGQRFDYLVRTRSANPGEVPARRAAPDAEPSYPQRDAVLFALRELTGKDAGPTTEAWQRLYPTASFDVEAARLSGELLRAPEGRRDYWINYLHQGKGTVYTEALADAIPRLRGDDQVKARAALAERLTRMTAETLRDKLEDESAEVRRAAARACAHKEDLALLPDLIARLQDAEPIVVQAARATLKELTGEDHGPSKDAGPADRARTVAAWRDWLQKQSDR